MNDSTSAFHPEVQAGLDGAFMRDGFGQAPAGVLPRADGPLAGQRLAVKDVYEVQGLRTGGGSPLWLAGQQPARHSAVAVRLLLAAGCAWVGKTLTDELTYSLAGINAHYGTPRNPVAPLRIPGGSSSGSVVAVAAGHADVGLGTDCGGSIRVPASYCGLWGIRPTHGRIAADGCFTLAHSFDTVGVFTREGALLARVFETLAHTQVPPPGELPPLAVPEDVMPVLEPAVREAFFSLMAALPVQTLAPGTLDLDAWAQAFRPLQAAEVWQQHGAWFQENGASAGADIAQRFQRASQVQPDEVAAAQRVRAEASARLAQLLQGGRLLLMPTVPTVAPWLTDSAARVDVVRMRSQQLLCLAGLAGLPQVSLPWTQIEGAPVGLSLIGPRGADEVVLAGAQALHRWCQG